MRQLRMHQRPIWLLNLNLLIHLSWHKEIQQKNNGLPIDTIATLQQKEQLQSITSHNSIKTTKIVAANNSIESNNSNRAAKSTINIYPNPSNTGVFNIISNNEVYKLCIVDALGQVLLQTDFVQDKIVDLSKYNRGVYYLKIFNSKEVKIFKIIYQ